jgi:hypothetical protein
MIQKSNNNASMHTPEGYEPTPVSHNGPVLGVLVLMLVLILGGLYLWGGELKKQEQQIVQPPIINNEPETPRAEADVDILNTLSSSDELDALQADITNTNLDSINADLNTVDAETNALFAE